MTDVQHSTTGVCPTHGIQHPVPRAEPREKVNEPLTCPRCGSEEHGGDVGYDGCGDCRERSAAGSSVPDTSGERLPLPKRHPAAADLWAWIQSRTQAAHEALDRLVADRADADAERIAWEKTTTNIGAEHKKQLDRAVAAEAEVAVLTARLEASEDALPDSFYAHLPLEERVERLVDLWRRATAICNEAESQRGRVCRRSTVATFEDAQICTCLLPLNENCAANLLQALAATKLDADKTAAWRDAYEARALAAEADRDKAREYVASLHGAKSYEQLTDLQERCDRLTARLTEAERALTHYADADHWSEEVGDVYVIYWYDGGEAYPWTVARAALDAAQPGKDAA